MGKRGKRESVQLLRLLENFWPPGGPPRRQGRPPAGRHQLRRREASAAEPHRRQTAGRLDIVLYHLPAAGDDVQSTSSTRTT